MAWLIFILVLKEQISGKRNIRKKGNFWCGQRIFKHKAIIKDLWVKIWDTMKRPNIRMIGIEEREEIHLQDQENISNNIMEENFHNLKKNMTIKVQEA